MGDGKRKRGFSHGWARARGKGLGPSVYALSLAIYCTSWTYYGAVGTAARDGWEYLPIYIGPVIGLTLLFPLWRRIAAAARRENVGSMADFVASRYGKSGLLAGMVTIIVVLGILPYISIQLKAIATSFSLLRQYPAEFADAELKSGQVFEIKVKEKLPERNIVLIYDMEYPQSIAAKEFQKFLKEKGN